MRRFFGGGAAGQESELSDASKARFTAGLGPDYVVVKHGKKNLRVDFAASGDIASGSAKVGDVRATTARTLGLAKSQITLIYAGRKLKLDSDSLAKLGISSGSNIMCLVSRPQQETKPNGSEENRVPHHSHHHHPHPHAASHEQRELKKELTSFEKIDKIVLEAQKELVPMIEEYVASTPTNDQGNKYRLISELILRRMFALDEVDTHGDPEARKHRKEAINMFHQYQSRVDEALNAAQV
ncbi:uncharacterized protein V1516DRAFT_674043 [Lipomyces oligophaga]|uniref:uncharacterized protein n=1 Tax=Lipomyces oligophaga TaxID=45792 RepID=UPI0034CE3883